METTQESITKNIANTITIWKTYNWKDTDLWKLFQDDFKGYTEYDFKGYTKYDFKLVNNNNIWRLCNFLWRRGV